MLKKPTALSKPLSVAISGNAASGKTTVCNHLKRRGYTVLNADKMAKDAVTTGSPGLKKIADHFGPDILTHTGALDRKKLRRIITTDKSAQNALEKIIHPELLHNIFSAIDSFKTRESQNQNPGIIFTEIPLLFELGLESRFDRHILVTARREILLKRLASRDNVTIEDADRLLNIQMPPEKKTKRADIVITNDGTLGDLKKQTDMILRGLRCGQT